MHSTSNTTPTNASAPAMAAHTTGPWSAGHNHGELHLTGHSRIFVPGALGIAVFSMGCTAAEVEATANLVALSPSLASIRTALEDLVAEDELLPKKDQPGSLPSAKRALAGAPLPVTVLPDNARLTEQNAALVRALNDCADSLAVVLHSLDSEELCQPTYKRAGAAYDKARAALALAKTATTPPNPNAAFVSVLQRLANQNRVVNLLAEIDPMLHDEIGSLLGQSGIPTP